MLHVIVSVRDAKADVFGPPQCFKTEGVAVRSFEDVLKARDGENLMAQFPSDFALYYLGKFNDATGSFSPEMPKVIVQADQIIRKDGKV